MSTRRPVGRARGPSIEASMPDWLEAISTIWRPLETDFRYSVTEVKGHFRGDYVTYRSGSLFVSVEHAPEIRWFGATLGVYEGDPPGRDRSIDVADLLRYLAGDPNPRRPAIHWDPPDFDTFRAVNLQWVRDLQVRAPTILEQGLPPLDSMDARLRELVSAAVDSAEAEAEGDRWMNRTSTFDWLRSRLRR